MKISFPCCICETSGHRGRRRDSDSDDEGDFGGRRVSSTNSTSMPSAPAPAATTPKAVAKKPAVTSTPITITTTPTPAPVKSVVTTPPVPEKPVYTAEDFLRVYTRRYENAKTLMDDVSPDPKRYFILARECTFNDACSFLDQQNADTLIKIACTLIRNTVLLLKYRPHTMTKSDVIYNGRPMALLKESEQTSFLDLYGRHLQRNAGASLGRLWRHGYKLSGSLDHFKMNAVPSYPDPQAIEELGAILKEIEEMHKQGPTVKSVVLKKRPLGVSKKLKELPPDQFQSSSHSSDYIEDLNIPDN